MIKSPHIVVSTLLLVLGACTQDEQVVPGIQDDGPSPSAYAPLTTGSYWIYERYQVDTAGNAVYLGYHDSCYVASDTLIGGETYAVYMRPETSPYNAPPEFFRDSAGYVVNPYGNIQFAENQFGSLLDSGYTVMSGDTLDYWTRSMVDDGLLVTVPAGTFATKTYRHSFHFWPPLDQTFGTVRNLDRRYAEDVGIILETLPYFFGIDTHQERRLHHFHIAP